MAAAAQQKSDVRGVSLAAVAVLVALPLLFLPWLEPSARDLERAALVHELLVYPVVLIAGLLFHLCWRLARNPTTGWLSAAVTLLGTQGIGVAAIRIARPEALAERAGWLLLTELAVQALLVAMTAAADRRHLSVNPFGAGLVLGVVATAVRVAVLEAPPLGLSDATLRALATGVLAEQVLVGALILRLRRSPLWLRVRLAGAAALLAFGHFLTSPTPAGDMVNGIAIGTSVLGAAGLIHAGLSLLQVKLHRHGSTVDSLHRHVEHLEADVRVDRARLHEFGATIAGIASASELLRNSSWLPEDRREALERAINAEASRLQRLLDDRRLLQPEDCDLGRLLDPIVTSHRARGRTIHWHHDGSHACGRPDDIAEAVNILLENAAQHAGTPIDLHTRIARGAVEIRVVDQGPGIPPHLGGSLFQWGHRGDASHGQGIGLHIAHRLITEQGGSLRLAPSQTGRGATFIATLPHSGTAAGPTGPLQEDADDAI